MIRRDSGNVVGQFNGSGSVLAHYTYGLGLTSQIGAAARALLQLRSDREHDPVDRRGGAVLNSYSYLPFGQLLSSTGTAANPFTYVGQFGVMDAGNGLYFMRNGF